MEENNSLSYIKEKFNRFVDKYYDFFYYDKDHVIDSFVSTKFPNRMIIFNPNDETVKYIEKYYHKLKSNNYNNCKRHYNIFIDFDNFRKDVSLYYKAPLYNLLNILRFIQEDTGVRPRPKINIYIVTRKGYSSNKIKYWHNPAIKYIKSEISTFHQFDKMKYHIESCPYYTISNKNAGLLLSIYKNDNNQIHFSFNCK